MADETLDNLVVNNTLGIGTTAPAAPLHVAATEGIPSKVFVESVNGSLLKVTAEPHSVSIGTENAFPLSINTNGIARIQISSDGNVGIGTQSVNDAVLAVNGTVKATAFQGDGSRLTGKVNTAGGMMTGPLTIQANLSVNGNVGIGTTTPQVKLEVEAVNNAISVGGTLVANQATGLQFLNYNTQNAAFRWSHDGSRNLVLEDASGTHNPTTWYRDIPVNFIVRNGNVGIGTIPKQIFAGNDSSKVATPLTIKATGNAQGLITFEDADGKPTWHINQKFSGISGLNFVETGVADGRLFIAAGGNVGIGKANPTCKLDVAGDLKADVIHSTGGFKFPDGTVQTTAIRIASGRVAFDKQSGVIINRRTVQFSEFNLNPTVLVALATIDADRNANLRIHTFVENLTKNSFDICLSSWADTTIWSAQVVWIAFGS